MPNDRKVAVITGASQGIGAALVKAYRDRNYRVIATARSQSLTRSALFCLEAVNLTASVRGRCSLS